MMNKNSIRSYRFVFLLSTTLGISGACAAPDTSATPEGDMFMGQNGAHQRQMEQTGDPFGYFEPQHEGFENKEATPFMEAVPENPFYAQKLEQKMAPYAILESQVAQVPGMTQLDGNKGNMFLLGTMTLLNEPPQHASVGFWSSVKASIKEGFEKFLSFFKNTDVWNPLSQKAEEKLEGIAYDKQIQSNVIDDFAKRLAVNIVDRAAIDELIHENFSDQINAISFIQHVTDNPVVMANFGGSGAFSLVAEKAMGDELRKLGYFEQVPAGSMDPYKAVRKVYFLASSPKLKEMQNAWLARTGID